MHPMGFCHWLKGALTFNGEGGLTADQTKMVKDQLALVFKHVIDQQYPDDKRADLQAVHDGEAPPKRPTFVAMC